MDRLRQEFRILDAPCETEAGQAGAYELLSLWEVLGGYGKLRPSQGKVGNVSEIPERKLLASLVKNVQGEDPKRWARRIEQRISKGDESVSFLQKQAARSALR